MKITFPLLFACLVSIPVLADDAKTNSAPDATAAMASTNSVGVKAVAPVFTAPVTAATVSAPFVLTNGMVSVTEQSDDLSKSGKAVFSFTIATAGNYLVKAIVNAPGEDSNSFYVNMDAQPEDPLMIWDMEVTSNFEERTVSWRGNGDAGSDEISPKVFTLTEGPHKLIILAREAGTELKSVSIVPQAGK